MKYVAYTNSLGLRAYRPEISDFDPTPRRCWPWWLLAAGLVALGLGVSC